MSQRGGPKSGAVEFCVTIQGQLRTCSIFVLQVRYMNTKMIRNLASIALN